MFTAVALAPIVLAIALGAAAVAKLRGADSLDRAFVDLRVPALLRRRWAFLGLPWAELFLAVALLVLPAPWVLVAGVPATLLMAAYVALVLRAVLAGEEVSCRCFGAAGDGAVDRWTVLRNVLLLGAGVVVVVDGVVGGSFLQRVGRLSAGDWLWLLGTLLVVAVALVVVRPSGAAPTADAPRPEPREGEQRPGIPFLEVESADGRRTSLPELASLRPVLLVLLSTTCASCARVGEVVEQWPDLLPEVDVRVVAVAEHGETVPPHWPGVLRDPGSSIARVLGMAWPSAVLLGADALIAAGPVQGASAVIDLVAEIRSELDLATQPDSSPAR